MFSKFKDYIISTFFYAGITPEEYDGYQELCDAANVAGADGLISEQSAELMAKFTKKISNAHYNKQIKTANSKKFFTKQHLRACATCKRVLCARIMRTKQQRAHIAHSEKKRH